VALRTGFDLHGFDRFRHSLQRFQVRQPGHDKLLFVGLARPPLDQNVVGERLACLDERGVIPLLEVLENRYGAFDGGQSDGGVEFVGYRYPPACGRCLAKLRP
jgi:hypothetical protein